MPDLIINTLYCTVLYCTSLLLSHSLSLSHTVYFTLLIQFYTYIYISWTENKDNKKLFFEQLGEWYTVEDTPNTDSDTHSDTDIDTNGDGGGYCLLQPNITCHYRDKPSKIPCLDSPTIVKNSNAKSFW